MSPKPKRRYRRSEFAPVAAVPISIRLRPSTVATLRASGAGWQTRAAAVLDRYADAVAAGTDPVALRTMLKTASEVGALMAEAAAMGVGPRLKGGRNVR